ncbi:hypothetical protein AAG570_002015 [Ranatra chinensis]|uniref:Uncharacterized protein n=1 Tax=Ranatra chinensis TaxID=642074 RepID=A0ABD0YA78_9HEMI
MIISGPAGDRVVDNDEGRVLTSGRGGHRLPTFDEELFRRQAEEANYSFESSVSDTINDSTHIRQETRDGLKLTGVYSYTDGFFKRTVHYVADENGYRVLKEESEPIGFGPKINPAGHVDVSTNIGGNSLQYTITAADIPSLFERNNVEQINQRKAI